MLLVRGGQGAPAPPSRHRPRALPAAPGAWPGTHRGHLAGKNPAAAAAAAGCCCCCSPGCQGWLQQPSKSFHLSTQMCCLKMVCFGAASSSRPFPFALTVTCGLFFCAGGQWGAGVQLPLVLRARGDAHGAPGRHSSAGRGRGSGHCGTDGWGKAQPPLHSDPTPAPLWLPRRCLLLTPPLLLPCPLSQRHHLAREVFLSQQRDGDTMDAILRRAHVLSPRDFGSGAACSGLGEDVFVCEYLYDSAWRVRQAGRGCAVDWCW